MTGGQRFFGGSVRALPEAWTPDLVAENLVIALRYLRRMPGGGGSGGGDSWPRLLREAADYVQQLQGGETFAYRNASPLHLTADQVSRMNAVIEWQAIYLKQNDGPARMLALWLFCKTSRMKYREALSNARVPPATAYRARDRALSIIARGLERDQVPIFGMGRLR